MIEVSEDDEGKRFLQHEYNRDGESYRSPNDNKYYPDFPEGGQLPEHLKVLEAKFNFAWAAYAKAYFADAAISSVYLAESQEENGFQAAFLIKKNIDHEKHIEGTCWDSIHVVSLSIKDNKCYIDLTSTVFITFQCNWKDLGQMALAGSCAKVAKKHAIALPGDYAKNPNGFYLSQIGAIVEENEGRLRETVNDHYITKQRLIINTSRINEDYVAKGNTQLMEMNK
jgi:capping protein (actin filament) muscle Z-line, beta